MSVISRSISLIISTRALKESDATIGSRLARINSEGFITLYFNCFVDAKLAL